MRKRWWKGTKGILDPFLFLQHQITVISFFLVSLAIIHSYATPCKTANSCTVALYLYLPGRMAKTDKSSRLLHQIKKNVELGYSAIGILSLRVDVKKNQ